MSLDVIWLSSSYLNWDIGRILCYAAWFQPPSQPLNLTTFGIWLNSSCIHRRRRRHLDPSRSRTQNTWTNWRWGLIFLQDRQITSINSACLNCGMASAALEQRIGRYTSNLLRSSENALNQCGGREQTNGQLVIWFSLTSVHRTVWEGENFGKFCRLVYGKVRP